MLPTPHRRDPAQLPAGLVLDVPEAPAPYSGPGVPPDDDRFTFALISDRTGDARPGVFERGIAALNALNPVFAVQVGDLVEGYTEDPAVLDREWAEIDAILAPLRMPLFHVPGNHDVANDAMRARWLARYGRLYYHFRYRGVLFLLLNTQDPEIAPSPEVSARLDARLAAAGDDEDLRREAFFEELDWEGVPQAAALSDEQLAYAETVLAEHADARHTVVVMHMPLWQGSHDGRADGTGHPAFLRLRAALGDRPHTMFSGHVHNYRATEADGNRYIRLGPTGGCWVYGDGDPGNVDHVTLVTIDRDGPHIANLALDGIRGADGTPV